MLAFEDDIKKPFQFFFNVDCVGEDIALYLYTIGTETPAYSNIEVTTEVGGLKGSEKSINIDLTDVAVGVYAIIAKTEETGTVGTDILTVLAEDAYSSVEL